jgi:hypothetical protein
VTASGGFFFFPAYFFRIAAAITGSGSGNGTACIDTTHSILQPQTGQGRDRSQTLAGPAAMVTHPHGVPPPLSGTSHENLQNEANRQLSVINHRHRPASPKLGETDGKVVGTHTK